MALEFEPKSIFIFQLNGFSCPKTLTSGCNQRIDSSEIITITGAKNQMHAFSQATQVVLEKAGNPVCSIHGLKMVPILNDMTDTDNAPED